MTHWLGVRMDSIPLNPFLVLRNFDDAEIDQVHTEERMVCVYASILDISFSHFLIKWKQILLVCTIFSKQQLVSVFVCKKKEVKLNICNGCEHFRDVWCDGRAYIGCFPISKWNIWNVRPVIYFLHFQCNIPFENRIIIER